MVEIESLPKREPSNGAISTLGRKNLTSTTTLIVGRLTFMYLPFPPFSPSSAGKKLGNWGRKRVAGRVLRVPGFMWKARSRLLGVTQF